MTFLTICLWVLFGAVEIRRALSDGLVDERETSGASRARRASAIRQSCEAPTQWGQSF